VALASRPKTLPADTVSLPARRARRGLALALASAALVAALLAAAAPAGAIVAAVKTGASTTTVGLQQRTQTNWPANKLIVEGSPASFANESGHVVLHGANVYAIYWDPQNLLHHEWLAKIDNFLQRMGASSGSQTVPFADIPQFRDRTNTGAVYKYVFEGSYSDTAKYPAAGCADPNPSFTSTPITCLTDAQLREQLQSFIPTHGLVRGMGTIFYLLLPPGVAVCVDAAATRCSDFKVSASEEEKEERKSAGYKESFCSYHSVISPTNEVSGDGNTILYAVIPWSAGTAGAEGLEPPHEPEPEKRVYKEAFDCQDGGWDPSKHEEKPEKPKEQTEAEKEAFNKATTEEKARLAKQRVLEGPHIEEPNQEIENEGKGEWGDHAAGLADLIINQIAIEQANTVTNPLLNAWQDLLGREVTDECRDVFANTVGEGNGGSIEGSVNAGFHTEAGNLSNVGLSSPELGALRYYIQNMFSLTGGGKCEGGAALVPRFTAPNPVNANEVVLFDGMESTVGLLETQAFAPSGPPTRTYAQFSWNFGDGTPEVKGYAPGAPLCELPWLTPCAASILHAYASSGTYRVTLTVTDVAGNTAHVSHPVTVYGPLGYGSGAGGSGAGSSAAGKGGPPLASVSVLSHSLRSMLRSGLLILYSVNERVTGRFEVLLDKRVAHKLHLRAPTATGLAKDTPAQMVIGKSILVTLGGGHSKMRIQLPRSVTSRMERLHSVSLILRLVVRNAVGGTATVLTPIKLSH
jgi:hypothetical protein